MLVFVCNMRNCTEVQCYKLHSAQLWFGCALHKWNDWVFQATILHCKAILGWGQPGLMSWVLLWITLLVQDQLLDLLASSPARYQCTMDALRYVFHQNKPYIIIFITTLLSLLTWPRYNMLHAPDQSLLLIVLRVCLDLLQPVLHARLRRVRIPQKPLGQVRLEQWQGGGGLLGRGLDVTRQEKPVTGVGLQFWYRHVDLKWNTKQKFY